jgi:integrase
VAWLEKRGALFRIRFRYGADKYDCSLNTNDETEAQDCVSRLEENLRLLLRGKIAPPPPGADLGVYLLSDGKLQGKPVVEKPLTLAELFDRYQQLPDGIKEKNTRYTEDIHIRHFKRLLGGRTPVLSVTTAVLQSYVDARSRETFRGRPLSHATLRKEIGTFGSIWNKWALPQELVSLPAPTKGLIYRKQRQKPPFHTWEQIERQIARGGLSPLEEEELWESLFLTRQQIDKLLAFVRKTSRQPFLYPMFVFAAHTGARRSEIIRSLRDDFDFAANVVTIREKKRDVRKDLTFRHVPMSPLLRRAMADWFTKHPGGRFTICKEANAPITPQIAAHDFRSLLDGSLWEKVRGWHCFRHSFASNLAAASVDQRIIDAWMGHQTEEMRRRYRHLFPDQQQKIMTLVFGTTA